MATLYKWLLRSRPIVLRDGSTVALRHVQPHDAAAMLLFLKGLSPRAIYLRFCSGGANLVAVAREFTEIASQSCGVIALGHDGEIVAQAEYVPISGGTAEVAVVVADHMQGLGLATQLIEYLAQDAREKGIKRFVAEVLPSNEPMLAVFTNRFDASVIESDSICEVEFGISPAVEVLIAA